MPTLMETALLYQGFGLNIAPASSQTKYTVMPRWSGAMTRKLTERQLSANFANPNADGLCIFCGALSGNMEVIDFDQQARAFAAWSAKIEALYPNIVSQLVLERTQRGGLHVYYRTETVTRSCVLANGIDPATGVMNRLIETRAEGGLIICAPTPGYTLEQGSFASIPVIGDVMRSAMMDAARSLCEKPKEEPRHVPTINRRSDDDIGRVIDRAAAYLKRCPIAISGCSGHAVTMTVVRQVAYGFDLDDETALSLLNEWNATCQPPWSEKELRHKIKEAQTKPFNKPRGYLRDEDRREFELVEDTRVDLSMIMGKATSAATFKAATAETETSEATEEPVEPEDAGPGEFPSHLLEVGGFMGRVMAHNLATAHRKQPVLALAAAISLQAVLAGRKVRDHLGGRTNLYVIGVSNSGTGKDHARHINSHILAQTRLEGPEDIASDSGLVNALAKRPALLMQIDEFGKLFKTLANPSKSPHLYGIVGVLLKLFSSAGRTYQGKAYADIDQGCQIKQPNLVIYGTSVPSDFFESLTPESLKDGLVGRLLVFEGETKLRRSVPSLAPIPDEIKEHAIRWRDFNPSGGNLEQENPAPRIVPTNNDAEQVFCELENRCDDEQHERGDSWQGGIWARCAEKARRLALIHACSMALDLNAIEIDLEAARWACELSEYLTRRLIYLGGSHVSEGDFDAKQKRVLNKLRSLGGVMTASQYARSFQSFDIETRRRIMENLVVTGSIICRKSESTTKPKTIYTLPGSTKIVVDS